MADRLDNLKNAKCLVEAWEQKYGVGGHHTRWVNLRPSDVEWAVTEIERLREALYHCVNAISEWEKRPLGIEPWLLGAMDNARAALEGK